MRRIFLSFAAFATLMMAGCKKDLLDINNDPNRAVISTPKLTMPVALEGAARVSNQSYYSLAFWTGYWATSAGFSKPGEVYTYDITNTFLAGVWDNLYNNIADFNYIEKSAQQQNLPVYEAVAKVMKAYDYQQLVDLWGNVPYTEALQGSKNLSPKYDNGQAIYEDLVKQLDAAIVIFKKPATAATMDVAEDKKRILLFNDLLDKDHPVESAEAFIETWIKFANTLKLKLLVQQSQISGRDAYIKSNLSGLTSDDFLGLGEDALVNPGYLDEAGKFNAFYSSFYSSPGKTTDNYNSIRASDYGANRYLDLSDPRISFFYDKGSSTTYKGSVFGDPTGTTGAAAIGTGLLDPTGSSWVLTASESLFLQAEAAQRGYIGGNAQTLYEEAVAASFNYTHTSGASAYLAQANPDANWGLATDKVKLIITQKWFALNGLDILAVYNDYRRTGYPDVPLSTDPLRKDRVPVRLFYPQKEELLNTANVQAQGTINVFSSTVFWDK